MSEYINVEVKGLKKTFRALDVLGSVIQKKAAVDMTRSGALALARAMRKNCPVRTGNLKRSIKAIRVRKRNDKRVEYIVGFTYGRGAKYDGWYAHLVEFGAQPHTIPRKGERVLLTIGGNVFMGPINHPGHQPTRFVTRSFEEIYPRAIELGRRAFSRALVKYKK